MCQGATTSLGPVCRFGRGIGTQPYELPLARAFVALMGRVWIETAIPSFPRMLLAWHSLHPHARCLFIFCYEKRGSCEIEICNWHMGLMLRGPTRMNTLKLNVRRAHKKGKGKQKEKGQLQFLAFRYQSST